MSSLALMRFLESAPGRYDWGMKLITFGGVTRVHDAIAKHGSGWSGSHVLEIGCGTGAVTKRLSHEGAHVLAIDQNPEMLDIARDRLANDQEQLVELLEMTASEIDTFPEDSFDFVIISLSLSEMARHERAFVLCQAYRLLRNGGAIVVGDEVLPRSWWERSMLMVIRVPQLILASFLFGSWSTPIPRLANEVADAGFAVESEERWRLGSLAVIVARKLP